MPPVIRVEQVAEYENQEVSIRGWVYNRTHKGKLVFLLLRDGYGFVQCVAFKNDIDAELFNQLVHIPQESSTLNFRSYRRQ
jgi:asparaginyl-tRNA synthetase